MAIRVKREEFLAVLNRTTPGLSAKEFIEQSSCFVFEQGWVSTFNDEICCKTKTGLPVEFEGAVTARELLDYLSLMGDDDIDLVVGKGELQVRGSRKKSGFRMQSELLLPTDQVPDPPKYYPISDPEEFAAAVEKVIGVTGTDTEEFLTVCVNVTPRWIEACDRKQSSRYMFDLPVERPFLLRSKSMAHLIPLKLGRIGETESWVHFRNANLIVACRRYVEDFPSEQITLHMDQFVGAPGELPRGASEAAKLSSVFTREDKDNNKVTVSLTDNRMTVKGEGIRGWSTVELEMNYHGPDVRFRITPTMLEQLVRDYTKVELNARQLRVTGEKWTYLTVLGKVEDAEPAPVPVGAGEEPDDRGEHDDEGD